MENIKLADQQWIDIIAPNAPPDYSLIIMLLTVILLLITAVAGYLFLQNTPRRRALRVLKAMRGAKLLSGTERRHFVLNIARQLRTGLQVTRLDNLMVAGEYRDEWHSFYRCLTEHCYSVTPPGLQMVEQLNISACAWLKRIKSGQGRQSPAGCDSYLGEHGHVGPE